MNSEKSLILNRSIEEKYKEYIDASQSELNIIKKKYPKTFQLVNNILNKFWDNWVSKNKKLVNQHKIKNILFELLFDLFYHQLINDTELKKYLVSFEDMKEKPRNGRISLIKMFIESRVNDYLLVPNLIISAYEDSKGIAVGLRNSIKKLKTEKLKNQKIIKHGKKFTGKKITTQKQKLYDSIEKKENKLELRYGKSQKSSYKNAVREVMKGKTINEINREYKAFMKYNQSKKKRNNPIQK